MWPCFVGMFCVVALCCRVLVVRKRLNVIGSFSWRAVHLVDFQVV